MEWRPQERTTPVSGNHTESGWLPLLTFLPFPALLLRSGNRGDWTPVELFLDGIRVFDPAKRVWVAGMG